MERKDGGSRQAEGRNGIEKGKRVELKRFGRRRTLESIPYSS
jgi:hypothetical protein